MLGKAVWRGVAVAAACAGAMVFTLGAGDDVVRTVAFLSLVVAQAGLALVHRTHRWGANPWMAAAVFVPLVLAALGMAVPGLRAAFAFAPISWEQVGVAGFAGAIGAGAVDVAVWGAGRLRRLRL